MMNKIWLIMLCCISVCHPVQAGEEADLTPASLEGVPARAPLSGAGMHTKLGLLYLMDHIESQGMIELAKTGQVPIVKAGEFAIDRVMWCKKANEKTIGICAGDVANFSATMPVNLAVDLVVKTARERWLKIPEQDRPKIDFLEILPVMWQPKTAQEGRWYSAVITRAAPRVAQELKVRPIVLNASVGNLPVDKPEILDAMIPGLQAALHVGGAWGYQGYTLEYSMDPKVESWYSLRYRLAYDYFKTKCPQLMNLPMILIEGGVDRGGNADQDGWLKRGSLDQYTQWLDWYDQELKKDPYVLGVTLFKIGAPTIWRSFELEPVVPWLKEHYLKAGAPQAK